MLVAFTIIESATKIIEMILASLDEKDTGGLLKDGAKAVDEVKKYYGKASGVYSLSGTNAMKAGAVKAWDIYAENVAQLADRIADIENPAHDNILIQLPSSECVLSRGKENTVSVSVYNYRKTQPLSGYVQIVSPSGKILDTSDSVTVSAGGSTQADVTVTLTYLSNLGGLESGDYKIQFVENSNVIVERKAYLTV